MVSKVPKTEKQKALDLFEKASGKRFKYEDNYTMKVIQRVMKLEPTHRLSAVNIGNEIIS